MAGHTLVFFFLALLSLYCQNAFSAAPPLPKPTPVYTAVCDPQRYNDLGLDASSFAFCDKSLAFPIRAKDLVDHLTLAEKAAQLGNDAKGVKRLGIPHYNWWSEALHGVSDVGGGSRFTGPIKGATSFPLPILLAASFNQSLWKTVGQTISTEARAMHNLGVGGLTYWSPNINVVRDPRWGRTLETPGEDPLVTGLYAVNFVKGLQDVEGNETAADPNARPLKVSACCKHYAAYDVDKWTTFGNMAIDRFHFSANVTEQDMVETFLRPFEMCVKEGDVSSVMCSYNNINGIPTCVDARLLRGTIRGDWNLHGYIVSDCDSIQTIYETQQFINDSQEDAVAQVMKAGLDLDCMSYYPKYLESTVSKGLVKESDVDAALINNYIVLLRLGWFDGNPMYKSLKETHVCSEKHLELATEAAREGIVLLKNSGSNALPLNPNEYENKTILVVGPHANATVSMLGNYAGRPCRFVSPLEGLSKYANVVYQPGCADVFCRNESLIWNAVREAKKADAVVIVSGLGLEIEAEDRDRSDFELRGYQNLLIRQVAEAAKGPVTLVLFSGGPVNVIPARDNHNVDSIIWAGYPGQEGGAAIADVVFGKYNPGGRLPVTWYTPDYVWKLPMTSMQLRPIDELGYPGRTYKFYNGSVIYPFGYGLSYSVFNHTVLPTTQRYVEKTLQFNQHCHSLRYAENAYFPPCQAALVDDLDCTKNDITIEVEVTNSGKVDGDQVVMVYSRAPYGLRDAPLKQLIGFQRVFVPAGQSKTVRLELNSCKALSIVSDSAYLLLPSGEHTIIVGTDGSPDQVETFPLHVYLKK